MQPENLLWHRHEVKRILDSYEQKPQKNSPRRFPKALRLLRKSVIHQVALVFAILFVVSVVGNIVALHNFEVARRSHIGLVQSSLLQLYVELYHATERAFTYGSEAEMMRDITREVTWAHTRYAVQGLDTAIFSLRAHHNNKYQIFAPHNIGLTSTLHHIIRFDEDPSINLQIVTDKLYTLIENLDLADWVIKPQIPTQDLADAMFEAFREIENEFGWGGRRLW